MKWCLLLMINWNIIDLAYFQWVLDIFAAYLHVEFHFVYHSNHKNIFHKIYRVCINDNETQLEVLINSYNYKLLNYHGYRISYQRGCSTSWLEINKYEK